MCKLLSAALLAALISVPVIAGDVNIPPCTENCGDTKQSSLLTDLVVAVVLVLVKK